MVSDTLTVSIHVDCRKTERFVEMITVPLESDSILLPRITFVKMQTLKKQCP